MEDDKRSSVTTTIIVQPPELRRSAFQASLVGLAGNVFGSRYLLGQDRIVLGRDPESCDIFVDDSGVSRVHAIIERVDGGHRITDQGSKNGTLVEGQPVTEVTLVDGQQVGIGKSVLKYLRLNVVEMQYHDKMTKLSSTDELTGAFNRRHAWDAIEQEIARAERHARELSLVLFDLDHFKFVNDSHGHAAGDECLVQVAKRVGDVCRREDIFARIGGEEFIVVLPECGILEAAELAVRIRDTIADKPIRFQNLEIPLTVSLGVTDLEELRMSHGVKSPGDKGVDNSVELFVTLADAKLYEAKHLGRNRVAI